MKCNQCKSVGVGMVEQEGGTTQGKFTERYECDTCGATGFISGEASDSPTNWDRWGGVFEA